MDHDELINKHTEQLGHMGGQLDAIAGQMKVLTTSVDDIRNRLLVRLGGSEAASAFSHSERQRWDDRIGRLEDSMGRMKDWRAKSEGTVKGFLGLWTQIVLAVGVIAALWQGITARQSLDAALRSVQQQQQVK